MPKPTTPADTEPTVETGSQPAETPQELPAGLQPKNPLIALAKAVKLLTTAVEETQNRPCALCGLAKSKWDLINREVVDYAKLRHADALKALWAARTAELGIVGDPELDAEQRNALAALAGQLRSDPNTPDVIDFLPDAIKPDESDPIGLAGRMPQIQLAVYELNGTKICPWHMLEEARTHLAVRPGVHAKPQPQQEAVKPAATLLAPPPGMSLRSAAKVAKVAPSTVMPGAPE